MSSQRLKPRTIIIFCCGIVKFPALKKHPACQLGSKAVSNLFSILQSFQRMCEFSQQYYNKNLGYRYQYYNIIIRKLPKYKNLHVIPTSPGEYKLSHYRVV